MKEYKTRQVVAHVIFFVLINIFGKMVAEKFQLPIWFDAIGTIFAAYEFGPVSAAVIGATSNITYSAQDPLSMHYMIINAMVGYVAGVFIKRGYFKDAYKVPSMSMVIAFLSSILSFPLNILFNNGMTGNLWGDSVIGYVSELGIVRVLSCLIGEFYVDLLDKLFSVFVAFLVIKFITKISKKRLKKNIKNTINVVIMIVVLIAGMVNAPKTDAIAAEHVDKNSSENTENDIEFAEYVQTVYGNTNGIPGGAVNDIAQTQDGMIWVGTYGGLYQYDGNNFKLMSEYDSVKNVNCLYTDEEGRLWIGTNDNGLSICAKNEIVNVLDENGGLSSDSVRSVLKSTDGVYYVGTTSYLNLVKLVDGVKVVSEIKELTYVSTLTADVNGNVCAVTNDGKLAIIRDTKVSEIKESSTAGGIYTTAKYNEKGALLAATSNDLIEVYELKGEKYVHTDTYKCSGLENINDIMELKNGGYLVCSDTGIGYINSKHITYKINTNSFDSSVDNIMEDYQGNYWFSSSRLGLLKLTKSMYSEIYSRISGDEDVVNSVIKWNGNYYFGTDNGLVASSGKFDGKIENDLIKKLENVRIRCLKVDSKNHLWIATSGMGVIEADGSSYVNYTSKDGLVSDKTRSILELEDMSVAVSTDNGISIFKNGKILKNIGLEDGLTTTKTLCMYERNGYLYAGTDGSGVAIIKDGKVEKIISKADGIGSNIILRMIESSDKSSLIILTGTGIVTLSDKNEVTKITEFPYYNNFDAYITEEGNIWVLCSAGIYIVKEEELLANKITYYELLDTKKGLSQNLTANAWSYVDEKGDFYLCGDKGVVAINLYNYEKKGKSYRIELQSIVVDGVETHIDKEENNIIARDVTKIEICPKVLNYNMDDPYVGMWLEGFDSEPKIMLQSEMENQVYTNLKSGEYIFHLAIYDSDKTTLLEENTYMFTKEKEFYDNWWFSIYIYFILTIIIIYILWLLVGSQINKTIKIQRKELENLKLKQTADAALAASEAKDNFLALMSHDIRTPINAILGLNELVLRESNEKQINEYAQDIKSAGGTLLTLVNSILDFSKIEEGKMEIVSVRYSTKTFIRNLIKGVQSRAQAKNLELVVDIDSNLPCEMYGDDVRLTQIISNLLTNAIKYTREGYVKIIIKELHRDDKDVTLYVEVEDSGIGIKPEDRERLFESFVRLDEEKNHNIEGTGLGMSIVVNLLGLMGGKLNVESEYGKGSKFSFVIKQKMLDDKPIGDLTKENSTSDQKEKIEHLYAPNARILVVDDNDMNIRVAVGLLKINGVVPDTSLSGKDAIEKIKSNHYDIVFLDHMMPEMDGIETLKYIKDNHLVDDDTKIIILTANAIAGAKEQYLTHGFDDYLSKPIEIKELEDKLYKYLPDEAFEQETVEDNILEEETLEDKTIQEKVVEENPAQEEKGENEIGCGINTEIGLRYCMDSWDFYVEVMKEYVKSNKVEKLEELFEAKDYKGYNIQIHAAKSNSMNIGAVELSEAAKALELATKENDIEYVLQNHVTFIMNYSKTINAIEEFLKKRGDL